MRKNPKITSFYLIYTKMWPADTEFGFCAVRETTMWPLKTFEFETLDLDYVSNLTHITNLVHFLQSTLVIINNLGKRNIFFHNRGSF